MADRALDIVGVVNDLRARLARVEALGAARWGVDNGGGSEIGYDQITSPVTVSSTTEATGTTLITASAYTFDGGPVICYVFAPYLQPASVGGAVVFVSLFEGATQIGRIGLVGNPQAAQMFVPFSGLLRFTPSAASHTYKATAHQAGGNGTFGAGAAGTGGYTPAFIRFTRA